MDAFDRIKEINNDYYKIEKKGFLKPIFDKIRGNYKIFTKRVLVCFFILNLFAFGIPIAKKSVGKPYAMAKAFNVAAATVNIVYIFPLSHIFGYKNMFTLPFYGIRDILYNTSQSLYPENEGEKEVNWFTVRYAEFETLLLPIVRRDSGDMRILYYKKYDKVLLEWIDELHDHLKPFATEKIIDPAIRKLRFNLFVNYAFEAYFDRYTLVDTILSEKPENKYKLSPILKNKEQMQKIEDALIYYNKLKDYAKKNEQDGLDFFKYHTNNFYVEDFLKWQVSSKVLKSKLVNDRFSCNDPYIKTMGESFSKLNEYQHNSFNCSRPIFGFLSLSTDDLDQAIAKKCLKNDYAQKYLKTYNQFVENQIEDYNKFSASLKSTQRAPSLYSPGTIDIHKHKVKDLNDKVYTY